ncbi:MAG TPA: tetratricopeptide repeat protein [Magnetospirillaceae bacterium]|jgi:Tfp pilus assembly protein PilF
MADVQSRLQQAFTLHRAGSLEQAAELYRSILAEDPENADALHLLGLALKTEGKMDEALGLMQRAIAANPTFGDAHYNLGNLYMGLGRNDEAIVHFRRAIALKPELAEAYYNLGNTLRGLRDLEGAEAAFRDAIAARPAYVDAYHNLANVLSGQNRVEMAIASYRRAIELKPDLAEAYYNLSLTLLVTGAIREGFELYERRWDVEGFPTPRRNFRQPTWDGTPMLGKTLLIHSEQGLGDTLQFLRYVSHAAQRLGGNVIFETQKAVVDLARRILPDATVLAQGEPLPAFDTAIPLLSLPRLLGTKINAVPYASARPERVEKWRETIGAGGKLRVGIVWAGNPEHKNDHNRSLPIQALDGLPAGDRFRYFSLQMGGPRSTLPQTRVPMVDLGEQIQDFDDTAAVLSQLDLVIACDTAIAHLAGALARPVWVLLPFAPDWRWQMARPDSPWYPTMTLYRQDRRGDWATVIARVAADLKHRIGG